MFLRVCLSMIALTVFTSESDACHVRARAGLFQRHAVRTVERHRAGVFPRLFAAAPATGGCAGGSCALPQPAPAPKTEPKKK